MQGQCPSADRRGWLRHDFHTYWTDSGVPVNIQDLSGRPPLSTILNKQTKKFKANKRLTDAIIFTSDLKKYASFLVSMKIARLALPGAICILHPDSCCMREICSPPLPITSKKKKIIDERL